MSMKKVELSVRQTVKISIAAALTLAVAAAIFVMSSQTGGQSTGASNGFGEWALGLLGIRIPEGQTASDVVLFAGLKIRNLAHIFLYACLGATSYALASSLWGMALPSSPVRVLFSALCAFGFSLLYAFTDEFHQYFVPGRTAAWRDIGMDCIGISLAVALCAAAGLICGAVARARSK